MGGNLRSDAHPNWGSSISCKEEFVAGAPLLRRKQEVILYLWVDALYINQLDINERNHQVNQMGDIYRRAKRVIVRLRPSCNLGTDWIDGK